MLYNSQTVGGVGLVVGVGWGGEGGTHTKSFLLSRWNVRKFLERGELMKFNVVFDVWKIVIISWGKKSYLSDLFLFKSLGVVGLWLLVRLSAPQTLPMLPRDHLSHVMQHWIQHRNTCSILNRQSMGRH